MKIDLLLIPERHFRINWIRSSSSEATPECLWCKPLSEPSLESKFADQFTESTTAKVFAICSEKIAQNVNTDEAAVMGT
jgi:hypothetical protein